MEVVVSPPGGGTTLRAEIPGRGDYYDDHMVRKLTATQVKATILALLDEVAAGDEVEITKHGRTVARLVPATGSHALRGSLVGVAMTASKDESLFATGAPWQISWRPSCSTATWSISRRPSPRR
jgi:prevent-host-death family protein